MNAEAASAPLPDSRVMLHYRAEAHTHERAATVHLLGYWQDLGLAQQSCEEHAEGHPHLTWQQVCNGLWVAQGDSHRYQIVLFLGPLC